MLHTITRMRRTARPPRRRSIVDVKLYPPSSPPPPPVAPPPRPNPDTIAGTHGRRAEMRSKSVTGSAASRLRTTRPPKHAPSRRERGRRSLLDAQRGGRPRKAWLRRLCDSKADAAPGRLQRRRHQKSWRSEEGAGRGRGRGRSAERCGGRERRECMCCGRARAVGGACAQATLGSF